MKVNLRSHPASVHVLSVECLTICNKKIKVGEGGVVLFQYFIMKTFSRQENLHYPKFDEEEEYFRGFVQLGLRTTAGTEMGSGGGWG